MSSKQTDPKATGGTVHENGDPAAEEVNRLHDLLILLDDEKAMERIDVLEDMLDIMNEQ